MTNEAAERVRQRLGVFYREPIERILFDAASRDLDDALAAERKATMQRIRAAYGASDVREGSESFYQGIDAASANLFAILDAEAER